MRVSDGPDSPTMDFELSDDQVALQDAARDLLDSSASPRRVRRVFDADEGVDRELWEAMVEQGWPGIAVPEELGGVGLGAVEAAVLLEQVGAHVGPAPFLQNYVALDALVRAVENGVGAAGPFIDRLVGGDAIGTVAWTAVEASADGGGHLLRGETEPVIFGPLADLALVRATDGSEQGLYLVELASCRPTPEPAMDRTRQLGWLRLDGVAGLRLGGADAVEAFLDTGATAHAAEMLGGASRALEMSVEYAKQREQFGRPIGSFQAVKHRCADMLVDVEGMRSAVHYAAWAIGARDADRSVAASTAKTWCSDASKRVMASALQVHGGIGFTWEHDIHFFLKRAQLDQVSFGDAVFHRARLGELLRERVAAGESVI